MLPVIPHHPEKFRRNIQFCVACPDLDTKSGLCKGGVYHSHHCNADYCPAGKFGGAKPEHWPHAEEARLNVCRNCRAAAGHVCGIDRAGIRDHAREAICPAGFFSDGTAGELPAAPEPGKTEVEALKPGKCCGG